MAEPQELNSLSIRCNRRMPECGTCKDSHAECVYGQRKTRTYVRTPVERIASIETTLATIKQRLERIEQNCQGDIIHKYLDTSSPNTTSIKEPQCQSHPQTTINHMANINVLASSSNLKPGLDLASNYQELSWYALGTSEPTSLLQRAIDEVKHRVGQRQNEPTRLRLLRQLI
ncbi:hypothetical protein N7450_011601 [Penicillium hetheringtonii]|uniref:Zn(2)-C6 fungal-type domain-containing protein n=1 Tax=Penicillium hetheringtonii TaxID=911720 RepID=A0AAD6DB66_9EURO|nr:hypothetical protein N7450_011601 [Penicillium hetheringtonii]